MPITSRHPEYSHWEPEWKKCRDAFDGQSAVKKAGVMYLPKLSEQTADEYSAYKGRALFYSITSKSVGSLVGMAIHKPAVLKYPSEMDSYFKENSGIQFHETYSMSVGENLLMGRYGLLIDRPKRGGKPYIRGYVAEDIVNWKTDEVGKPYLVVLREAAYDEDTNDEYTQTTKIIYRELRLLNGVYVQILRDENDHEIERIIPTNTGKPMDYIPFYVVNPFGVHFNCTKPPVLDIVEINMSHYRTSADLEHGRHFTGLPTPVVIGVAADTKLKIGSLTAWVLPDSNCDAKYLEFTGQGLKSLENALKEKEAQLASLSARLISQGGNGSEAAETVQLRYMSETASLTTIIRATESLLNLAFKCIARMEDLNENEVNIVLDKEFLNTRLSAADILKLTESMLNGGMSPEAYVFHLRRGDAIPADRSDADEIAAATAARQVRIDAEKAKETQNQPGGPIN